MRNNSCDVLIVGAGPSGCAAAMSLPAGMSALLIDRRTPGHSRCCGGLIAPDAQAAIAGLGLTVPPGVRTAPEPRFVHALDYESGIEQTYRRDYWNVNRDRFDAWLLELASGRVRFRARTRLVEVERKRGGFSVRLSHRDAEETVRCRFIIGADGARSTVRTRFFAERPRPAVSLAIQATLPTGTKLSTHEVIFANRLTDFYAWAIPKQDHVLVGSAFRDFRTAKPKFEEILRIMCRQHGFDARPAGRCARLLSRPGHRNEFLHGADNVLLVGEAAGLVSPSSGEGISFAIESGMAAGRSLEHTSPASRYGRWFRKPARKAGGKIVKAWIVLTPWTRKLALRSPWCP